jgi:hypothetical protein
MLQDLSQYILDISENSLKAEASRVDILLSESTRGNGIELSVSDNGKGMDSEQILMVQDPFFTTRTERRVGLGIPFLKQAAELCGGGLEIISQKRRGTTIRASFTRDCIDCPPLGDISATLVVLFVGWPDRDFVFRYFFDGREFSTGTDDIIDILEDRNLLKAPEVAGWLGRFFRENIDMLRSGREC